jgi:hypothetical protein
VRRASEPPWGGVRVSRAIFRGAVRTFLAGGLAPWFRASVRHMTAREPLFRELDRLYWGRASTVTCQLNQPLTALTIWRMLV